jgi:5'-methylthioadenosine phosphorylase
MKIGILAGTGMNNLKLFEKSFSKSVTTPYGDPSDSLICGEISGVECVYIPRHGLKHTILPSKINYRANLWALKEEGCSIVITSSLCGGLQEYTKPGDFVILDQFIDQTRFRQQTFYDGEAGHLEGVLHIPMSEPYCEELRQILIKSALECGGVIANEDQLSDQHNFRIHERGCVVTIEGPRFSSRAESMNYHRMGAQVITMTAVPEVVLAKELGMSYATLAMVTDYDSWHPMEKSVSVDIVLENFRKNCENVRNIFLKAVPMIAAKDWTDILHSYAAIVRSSFV